MNTTRSARYLLVFSIEPTRQRHSDYVASCGEEPQKADTCTIGHSGGPGLALVETIRDSARVRSGCAYGDTCREYVAGERPCVNRVVLGISVGKPPRALW